MHHNHLGAPIALTDTTGNLAWAATYDAFGSITVNLDNVGGFRPRLPGQYEDAETGLYYNWHRYYDPRGGRYITSDPLGLVDGPNTYAYVGNNPVNYVDPKGLFDMKVDGGLVGHFIFGNGETVDLSKYCKEHLADPGLNDFKEIIRLEKIKNVKLAGKQLKPGDSVTINIAGSQNVTTESTIYSFGNDRQRYQSTIVVNRGEDGYLRFEDSTYILRYDIFQDPLTWAKHLGLKEDGAIANFGLNPFNMSIQCKCE